MGEQPVPISNIKRWLSGEGWSSNPFIFSISPELFVGYKEQSEALLSLIDANHKLVLLVGPTGSGKTSMLKWLEQRLEKDKVFVSKMPNNLEEFLEIFNKTYRKSIFSRLFSRPVKSVTELPDFLNKKISNHLVLMCDEIHEAPLDVLGWLRVLADQVNNITVILSGLPVFEQKLKKSLETFEKRISGKIELLSLTKEDTRELIKKRIESVGGNDIKPFTEDSVLAIFECTGGFPREIIRAANDAINLAAKTGQHIIGPELISTYEKPEAPSLENVFEKLTPKQVEIINIIKERPMSPGDIVNVIDLSKYRTKYHAVRSINNILKRLVKDGYIRRKKRGKSFVYDLSEKLRPLVVEA